MLWKGFQKPKRLAVDTSTLTDKYGIFWAQPFERGFGTTIGNALRRVLLSSIEGAAITAVKVEGVLHEFQSIPGVVEDATDIILNLKQIPIKMHTTTEKILTIDVERKGSVTAADLQEPVPAKTQRLSSPERATKHWALLHYLEHLGYHRGQILLLRNLGRKMSASAAPARREGVAGR